MSNALKVAKITPYKGVELILPPWKGGLNNRSADWMGLFATVVPRKMAKITPINKDSSNVKYQ